MGLAPPGAADHKVLAMTDRFKEHLEERRSQRYASTRLWNTDPNLIGMLAEREFARWAGIDQDLRDMPRGDGKIDYVIAISTAGLGPREFFLDVKGTRDGKFAQGPKNEIFNGTIYVLLRSDALTMAAYIRRWCWGYEIRQQPERDYYGNGPCIRLAVEKMRPMQELRSRMLWIRHKEPRDLEWQPKRRHR